MSAINYRICYRNACRNFILSTPNNLHRYEFGSRPVCPPFDVETVDFVGRKMTNNRRIIGLGSLCAPTDGGNITTFMKCFEDSGITLPLLPFEEDIKTIR